MKIIFLDIDGVMNSIDEIVDLYHGNPNQPHIENAEMPSPTHTKWLKKIIEETGARIVLSSSWRLSLRSTQKLIDWFEKDGIQIYGYTCDEVYQSELKGTKFESIKPYRSRPTEYDFLEPGGKGTIIEDRGAEVAYWLLGHANVESYVVIDDDSADIKQWHPNNFIKTSCQTGLLERHAKKAIEILNNTHYDGDYEKV